MIFQGFEGVPVYDSRDDVAIGLCSLKTPINTEDENNTRNELVCIKLKSFVDNFIYPVIAMLNLDEQCTNINHDTGKDSDSNDESSTSSKKKSCPKFCGIKLCNK